MIKASLCALASLLLAAGSSWAQVGNGIDNPDWAEEAAPPPPAFSKDRTIALEMPSYVSVKVGIDPQTIVVGNDGIVRYVVVFTNATGTVNASFEGIRCASDQVKVYARYTASGNWSVTSTSEWRDVTDNMASRHAYAFARQAACDVRISNSKADIIKALEGKKTQTKPGRIQFED